MNEILDIKQQFKNIVQTRYKKFFLHACIHVGCKETAKDLIQDTFLTAYQKLNTFKEQSAVETWLFGILNNKILEYYRKQTNEQKHIEHQTEEEILFHKNGKWKKEWLYNEIEEKEHRDEQNKLIQILKKCFLHLNEQYQKVFSLRFFANKKTNEVCKLCGITEDNVWQIIHRGKLQLKICIQSQLKNKN
ncbi:MAG: sigma-70 family RNA polymerase sigma factor [Bacteroidia bacterium]|nr:sigma-70 family RNA polymerase sigma factor [Bacteroidia bacterium]